MFLEKMHIFALFIFLMIKELLSNCVKNGSTFVELKVEFEEKI